MSKHVLIEDKWPEEVLAGGSEDDCMDAADERGLFDRDMRTGFMELRDGYSVVEAETCERCEGTGTIEISKHYRDCGPVDGEGPCDNCGGHGIVALGEDDE